MFCWKLESASILYAVNKFIPLFCLDTQTDEEIILISEYNYCA